MAEATEHNNDVITIEPARGWRSLGLREVWEYRELLYFFLWRELKGRYRQMALGPLWIVLAPIITTAIFTLVFTRWAKLSTDGLPAPLFYLAALLPWQLFAVAAQKSSTSLVDNLRVISKVYFPRLIVPLSTATSGMADFLMAFVVFLVMMPFFGCWPGPAALLLPLYLALAVATALAVGLWLACLAVRFRDVEVGVRFLLPAWMFLSPVIYPASSVPEAWRGLYLLNPMAGVIEGSRWCLLGKGEAFHPAVAISAVIVLIALVAGLFYFQRTERDVVDMM